MIRRLAVAVLLATTGPALAQQPVNLLPPAVEKPSVPDETPNFQPIRTVGPASEPVVQSAPVPPPPAPAPAPEPPPPAPAAIEAVPAAPSAPPLLTLPEMQPTWAMGALLVAGAVLAGLVGALMARLFRRGELAVRRQAVAATLVAELETRRLAFESVPLPPNAEAGVSFVSSVISLAGNDAGFRSAQGELFLLPPQLAAHLSVHYAAVQRVADFVKGQSLAAAVRMMQANRLGGHPCPDAGTMRDAHVEMGAAFRGIDKLLSNLRSLAN
jgi:hypothetical protein